MEMVKLGINKKLLKGLIILHMKIDSNATGLCEYNKYLTSACESYANK
jgi:hypothetical protein